LTDNPALHFQFLDIPEILDIEFRFCLVVHNENSRLVSDKKHETAKWRPDTRLLTMICLFHPVLKPAETVWSPRSVVTRNRHHNTVWLRKQIGGGIVDAILQDEPIRLARPDFVIV
jgi:hypothetical protein